MVARITTSDAIPRPVDPERVDHRWRCLEERVTAPDGCSTLEPEDVDAEVQYVWGERYIDDLILRDRDTTSPRNGTLNERLWVMQDANWNVVALADNSGNVVERYLYSGYGTPVVLTPAFASRGSPSYDWEYLFTGRRMDLDTGLMYYRNRFYHPGLGRFVSRDPVAYAGEDVNLYRYVGDSPISYVDPLGREMLSPGLAVLEKKPVGKMPGRGKPGRGKPGGGNGRGKPAPGTLPPGVPGDIEDDYGPGTGKTDCIFRAEFADRTEVKPKPPGHYFPGIESPNDLRLKCHTLPNGTCDRITVNGHGMDGGCGACADLGGPGGIRGLYGAWDRGCWKKWFKEISECFDDKLKPGGYIRIGSCSSANPDILQDIADATNATVCACAQTHYSGAKGQFSDCYEDAWVCKTPTV